MIALLKELLNYAFATAPCSPECRREHSIEGLDDCADADELTKQMRCHVTHEMWMGCN
jgi:hypothetical protein